MHEWACIKHWVENTYYPAYQAFAIGLRAEFTHPGQYMWQYADGNRTFPEYKEWAYAHPQDFPCVSMMIGTGVDHQGQWTDMECDSGYPVWAICEKM